MTKMATAFLVALTWLLATFVLVPVQYLSISPRPDPKCFTTPQKRADSSDPVPFRVDKHTKVFLDGKQSQMPDIPKGAVITALDVHNGVIVEVHFRSPMEKKP